MKNKQREVIETLRVITEDWGDMSETMGEMAALEVVCQQNGVTSEWYYDHVHLMD